MAEENKNFILEEVINSKLFNLKLQNFEDLPDRIKEYLIRIESDVNSKNKKRELLLKEYKALKISVKGVTDSCSISRQTIYNNKEILQRYIEDAILEQEKNDILIKISEYKEEVEKLQQRIFKMQVRDLQIEKKDFIIDEQNSIIKNKDLTIQKLEKRNMELIRKINELEGKRINRNSPIVIK